LARVTEMYSSGFPRGGGWLTNAARKDCLFPFDRE